MQTFNIGSFILFLDTNQIAMEAGKSISDQVNAADSAIMQLMTHLLKYIYTNHQGKDHRGLNRLINN